MTLGTFPTEFTRPLIAIDKLCAEAYIKDEVIVQSGHTEFQSEYLQLKPFIAPDELDELTAKARLVITHAGTGSLIKAIKLKKKTIAIARLSKFNEMVDDHQIEILDEFVKLNYILPWNENDSLKSLLENIENFLPSNYISQKQKIIGFLRDYIDSN